MLNSLLITTLGHSWQIIPELLGFTNPDNFVFYDLHPKSANISQLRSEYSILPVDELWIVSTDDEKSLDSIHKAKVWLEKTVPSVKLRSFILKNISDLTSNSDCQQMGDLIYRVVLNGKKYASGGMLYLSLSGGRKTMSADMQEAGNIFGCDAMIHIIDDGKLPPDFRNSSDISPEFSRHFTPIVPFSKKENSRILFLEPDILESNNYNIDITSDVTYFTPSTSLYLEIEERRKKSRNIAFNFYQKIHQQETSSNFYSLYLLDPDKINRLKSKKITPADYDLIKQLPKAELHCHLGGIADTCETVEIAYANIGDIAQYSKEFREFGDWLDSIKDFVVSNNLTELEKLVCDSKAIEKRFPAIKPPYVLAGFLVQFKGYEDILDQLIFGNLRDSSNFTNVGIEKYSRLGDLQGSGLLQSKKSLIAACNILNRKVSEHNLKYLELRCSPYNYTRGGLKIEEVVRILTDNLDDNVFKLILIATRHKKMSEIYRSIEFVMDNFDKFPSIVGFDLAGNEGVRSPDELRNAFLPILEKCLRITIHAGETAEAESIWEAVYHLNADRIGHGLKLMAKIDLMEKIKERKISIELCPSSNRQILDFSSKPYPLEKYLESGLKVTINTDNLGISRTDFTKEYVVASELSGYSLTLWDVLQLIKNSFNSAFCKLNEKRRIILDAEKQILEVLNEQFFR